MSDFPLNSAFCFADKRAIDNLAKQATAQGPKADAFFKEVRTDTERLRALLKRYNDLCPATNSVKAKRGTFAFVSYIEETEAQNAVRQSAQGKMMWKEEYMTFAKKPKGGSCSAAEAERRWAEWLGTESTTKDMKGPPEAPVRLRIVVGDFLNFDNAVIHSRVQQCQRQAPQKNVSAEAAAAQRSSLLREGERGLARNSDEAADLQAFGQALINNAASGTCGNGGNPQGAFDGLGLLAGDFNELMEGAEAAERERKQNTVSNGSSSSGGAAGQAAAPEAAETSPGKWVDWDRVLLVARKKATADNAVVASKLLAAVETCRANLTWVGSMGTEKRQCSAEAESIARKRMEWAEAVLEGGCGGGGGSDSDDVLLKGLLAALSKGEEKQPCLGAAGLVTVQALKEFTEAKYAELAGDARLTPIQARPDH